MILDETQDQRDQELSALTGVSVEQIRKYKIASPDAIRVFGGDKAPTTEAEIEELYKDYKDLNLVAYLRTLMYTSIYGRHAELTQLLRKTKTKSCLDFGSGVGTHGIALAQNKCLVTVLDVPGPLLDFTIKRFKHRSLGCIPLENHAELPENEFDIAICTDVLEHVFDPVKELGRICRSMKSNGIMHLQVSSMKKDSSGHFGPSIDRWQKEGPSYLAQRFAKVGNTTYVKR
jgi:ubiquinone/menaquinone biosynthesis C-methylase UbiE